MSTKKFGKNGFGNATFSRKYLYDCKLFRIFAKLCKIRYFEHAIPYFQKIL
jgi:hypothetical protein